jgi:hypothetical protein
VHGKATVNPELNGSKVAIWHLLKLKAGEEKALMLGSVK